MDPVWIAFRAGADEAAEWRQIARQATGVLRTPTATYPAVLEPGASPTQLGRLAVAEGQEPGQSECTGTLTQVSPGYANVHLDAGCAGPIKNGMRGVLIDGTNVIAVAVVPPNMPADRVGENEKVATLRVERSLGIRPRTVTLRLGEQTYAVGVLPPQDGVEARPELLTPPEGAELPLAPGQLIVFRWKDVGADEYRVSTDCKEAEPPTASTRVQGTTYTWAPPIGSRERLECLWVITALPGAAGSGTRRFVVTTRDALAVHWTDNGGIVLVDGTVSDDVTGVTVNGSEMQLLRGAFRTDVPFGTGPLTIVTVATLKDGSQIVDRHVVPH